MSVLPLFVFNQEIREGGTRWWFVIASRHDMWLSLSVEHWPPSLFSFYSDNHRRHCFLSICILCTIYKPRCWFLTKYFHKDEEQHTYPCIPVYNVQLLLSSKHWRWDAEPFIVTLTLVSWTQTVVDTCIFCIFDMNNVFAYCSWLEKHGVCYFIYKSPLVVAEKFPFLDRVIAARGQQFLYLIKLSSRKFLRKHLVSDLAAQTPPAGIKTRELLFWLNCLLKNL